MPRKSHIDWFSVARRRPFVSDRQLAKELDVTGTTIALNLGFRQSLGLPNYRTEKRDSGFVAACRQRWEAGESLNAIADALDVSRGVVSGVRWRHGFPERESPIRR